MMSDAEIDALIVQPWVESLGVVWAEDDPATRRERAETSAVMRELQARSAAWTEPQ